MKKIALSLLCAGFSCVGCAQDNHQVSGHLDGIGTDTLIVYVMNDNFRGMERMDTVPAPGGHFAFNIGDKLKSVYLFQKPSPGKRLGEEGDVVGLFVLPGEKAELSGFMSDCQLGGTAFYIQQGQIAETVRKPYRKRMTAISEDFAAKSQNCSNKDSLRKVVQAEYADVQKQMRTAAIEYISLHADEDATAILLAELEDQEAGLSLLTERVKNGRMNPYIQSVERRIQAIKERKAAAEKIQPGLLAPDFTLDDLDGKALSLSSLRGKYVVIDFWGSWCGWCIKGFPEMKKAYAKHKDKIEFLGVDCNDTEQKWRAAVAKHELPWLHVRNDKREPDVTKLYAIEGYPSKCIIDPEGKIVKMVVGEDPEFYTFLDDLLK